MHTLVGRLSRAAARRLLSPRKQVSWHCPRPFTTHGPPLPPLDKTVSPGTSGIYATLMPRNACQYAGAQHYHSSSREGLNTALEELAVLWRTMSASKNGQRQVWQTAQRRSYATEQKGGESFDPLKRTRASNASSKTQQELEGNSFVFVASRRENFFTLWWRRLHEAGKAVAALGQVPLLPLALGLGGAIPFVALAPPISSYAPLPDALKGREIEAQAAYGACILSFLGAPHWGLAMATQAEAGRNAASFTVNSIRYTWSVVPSLLAWPALLLPPVQKLALLVSAFGLTLGVDTAMSAQALLPKWYLPLRVLLTSVAMLSMGASLSVAATKPLHPSHPKGERRESSH